MTEVSGAGNGSGSANPDTFTPATASKSDTPHVLDELSKSNNAKSANRSRRRRHNGLRRFLIVLLLLAPLMVALAWLAIEQVSTKDAIEQLQARTEVLGSQVTNSTPVAPSIPSDLVNSQALDALRGNLESRINAVAAAYANLQETVSAASTEREDPKILWTESEYLLRLANQKLQLEGDKNSAILLLESVDQILAAADNPGLLRVREAIAAELVAVRAMDTVDTSGLYVRIDKLIPLVDQIYLRNSMQRNYNETVAQNQDAVKASDSGAIDKIVGLLSSIFVWQKREDVLDTPLFSEDELLLKQNLRLMLEQSQLALLQSEQSVYEQSLLKASQWVSRFFLIDSGAGRTLREELDTLAAIKLDQQAPDISRSLNLLRQTSDQPQLNRSNGSN